MQRIRSIALMAAACGVSNIAAAQGSPERAGEWIVPTVSGCKIILNAGSFYFNLHAALREATWSGGCDANGLANGNGELDLYFLSEGEETKADFQGRVANGLMQGAWKFATWRRDRPGGDFMGSGIYNYLTFSDGCMATFEKQVVREGCVSARGRQMQAGLIAATPPARAASPRTTVAWASGARTAPLDANRSKMIAGNGRSAMDCVDLVSAKPGDNSLGIGRRFIKNSCPGPVEITWCYADGDNACARGSGNMWTLGAGRAWPINPEREIRWAACHGANTVAFEKGTAGLRFICTAPKK